jgi:aconitate hydratase
MGVLPLLFRTGENAESLGLDGSERYDITGVNGGDAEEVDVTATREDGRKVEFRARVGLLTPKEREYFRHGGILQYVLRSLATLPEPA